MTTQETIDTIAGAVRRIEDSQRSMGDRLDKLERFADRAEGALTLVKFVSSLLGIGGLAAIVALFAKGSI